MIEIRLSVFLCISLLSCSPSPPAGAHGGDEDSGSDATIREEDAQADAGGDGPALQGNCEPVKGPCDLVLQDCPAGQQCALAQKGSGYTTTCAPAHPVQHIAKGYPCCPPATTSGDPCLPGLECIGNPCVGDAGGGRCTPHCCTNDDTPCGSSPEGFEGHCDLNIVDNANTPLYSVCDYAPPCKPLGIVPCPAGDTCLVQDTSGGGKCSQIFNQGAAALKEGQACSFANQCDDGMMCLNGTSPDGGSGAVCTYLCYVAGDSPPFDAGALSDKPGGGGCPKGERCAGAQQIFPDWLGVCTR